MNIDTLIFSGGGVKGIGFIGCLKALCNYNHIFQINKINHYIGTSAGSIIATMLAIGYNINEIEEIIINIDFNQIININSDNILQIINKYGIVDGDKFEKTIRIIIEKISNKDLTFLELYQIYHKKLTINSVSIYDKKNEYFNYINTPHLNISKAIRMSCSVPFLFQPYQYNNKLYIDGCVMDSICINQINTDRFIGFYIEDSHIYNINNIFEYLQLMTQCTTYQMNNYKIQKYPNKIHSINFNDIQSLNFTLDKNDKMKVINSAYHSTDEFINNKYLKFNSFYLRYDVDIVDNIINNIYIIDLLYIN